MTRTVSDNRSCKFLAPVSASSHYTLERFLSSAAECGIRASVSFKYVLKQENKMRIIVLGMSRNITLLNIAVERVAFLLFNHQVTYPNLDLDTISPQVVHQSSRQIPGYHLKLSRNCFLPFPSQFFCLLSFNDIQSELLTASSNKP